MTDIPNVVIGSGDYAVTVYTNSVEKAFVKKLIIVDPPNAKDNAEDGPKSTIVVDRQRRILRFTVRGHIASADEDKLTHSYEIGSSDNRNVNLTFDGTTFSVNIEKFTVTWGGKSGEQDELQVMLTAVYGEAK